MRRVLGLLLGAVCFPFAGCGLNEVAVDTTASVLAAAESSTRGYFDWESAGAAAAAGIMQLEGLHRVSPDNEVLSLILVKAYMAYAYGWVMDAHDVAEQAGDYEASEHHRRRAYLMYSRARDLALRVMYARDERFREHMMGALPPLRAYLREEHDDAEDDVPPLFWLLLSWTTAINSSDDSAEFVEMPALRVIAEHLVALDPGYEDAGALIFLGGFDSSYPEQVGGNPARGKRYFERALALTKRKNHIHLVNYATLYAVTAQDRALFVALLREVIEAGDQGPMFRLGNKVARRRALRLLSRVDELFM